MPYTIDEIKAKATPVAIRYGVDSLSLFGSYARGDADEKSDLDFLIQKGSMRGLLSYCGMIADLEDIFHCHVDLVMKNAIKDEDFLEEVVRDEVKLYERQKIRTNYTTQSDIEFQFASGMCILQLGELVARFDDDFTGRYPDIPWRQIKGLRNIYAHDYDIIDNNIIWETITEEIPKLQEKLQVIFNVVSKNETSNE